LQKAIVLTGSDVKRLKRLKALNGIAKMVNKLISSGRRKRRKATPKAKVHNLKPKKSKKYPTEADSTTA